MSRWSETKLHLRVMKELLRYDVIQALFGFRAIHKQLSAGSPVSGHEDPGLEERVHAAVGRLVPFYWKRVQCLQRSYVTARVLRAYGSPATIVFGYRLAPFMAHAWVEVGGRVVNDSPAFQSGLQLIERF